MLPGAATSLRSLQQPTDQAVQEVGFRHHALLEAEIAHQSGQDHGARDDKGGTGSFDPRQPSPVGLRKRAEARKRAAPPGVKDGSGARPRSDK